jgi:cytosine permease
MSTQEATKATTTVDSEYSHSAVPKDSPSKKSFFALAAVMLGFTFFSASMSVGARLANGLDLNGFLYAIVIGGAILGVYTGLLAYVGSKTGLSMDLLAHRSFGTIGSYLPSALISFTQIGWFGVGAAMFAFPVHELTGINVWVICIVFGLVMTASVYFGIKGITIVSAISVPLILILGVYSMTIATIEGGGWVAMFGKNAGNIPLLAAIGMVVGSFVSGGTATPNFIRFAKSARTGVIVTVIAFFLGNTLMFLFGAVGGALTGQEDIFYVMIAQGLALPAIIVLGANIWTTNDNALYSSSLGLANITKLRYQNMTIIAGIVGTVLAIWLYNNFVSWLNILSATLPPLGVILVLDYFINKERYRDDFVPVRKVNIGAVVGVAIGALVANLLPWGIAPLNAMVVSAVCYLIGEFISRQARASR